MVLWHGLRSKRGTTANVTLNIKKQGQNNWAVALDTFWNKFIFQGFFKETNILEPAISVDE